MKKIIPAFAVLLIAVAGIAFYMGQQTAVVSQGEDSTQQDMEEEYTTNDEIVAEVLEYLRKNPEAYIVQYEDLPKEVLDGFLIVYLAASKEEGFDGNLDKMSKYEQVHHVSAWQNLGLRVPDNSKALYMTWKFEYCGGYNCEEETPETQPEQKPMPEQKPETQPDQKPEQKPEPAPEPKPEQKPTNNGGSGGADGPGDDESSGFIDFSGLPVNDEPIANEGGGPIHLDPYEEHHYHPGVGFTG